MSPTALEDAAIRKVWTRCPSAAETAQVPASVVVELTIDKNGKPLGAKALSGHPLLRNSAVAAALGWRFSWSKHPRWRASLNYVGQLTFTFKCDDPPPLVRYDYEKIELQMTEINDRLRPHNPFLPTPAPEPARKSGERPPS